LALWSASFAPEDAAKKIGDAKLEMRTDAGRATLGALDADVAAAQRLRLAFVEWVHANKNSSISLPSAANPEHKLNYTLLDADETGFTAKLGPGQPKHFPFSEFKPADLHRLVLKGRIPETPGVQADAARIAVASGSPQDALAILEAVPGEDTAIAELRTRASRELQAQEKMSEIRALEKKAETDPRTWMEILVKVDEFTAAFHDTDVFLRNSNGALPDSRTLRQPR
jgi:hypothetical protein